MIDNKLCSYMVLRPCPITSLASYAGTVHPYAEEYAIPTQIEGDSETRLTFLGTGTSHGVPMIGCKCSVCTSSDPRNRRTRTSVIVKCGDKCIVIDTTPEFRLQCLANKVERLDAVLFTHGHADHIFGLDDIRRFNEMRNGPIPCFGSADTLATVRNAFDYVFMPTQLGGGKPQIELVSVSEPFVVAGVHVTPIPVMHGELPVLGYRIGRLGYITDCSFVSEMSKELLRGLDVLVLGALRRRPHETHFSIDQAIALTDEVSPGRTYFVHMSHKLDHEETNRSLPPRIELAYDGLTVDLSD